MGLINCYHNHPHNLDNHLFSFPWIYLLEYPPTHFSWGHFSTLSYCTSVLTDTSLTNKTLTWLFGSVQVSFDILIGCCTFCLKNAFWNLFISSEPKVLIPLLCAPFSHFSRLPNHCRNLNQNNSRYNWIYKYFNSN